MGNIIAWTLTGLIAGFLARWIVKDEHAGCLYTIAIGLLGALVGGGLMQLFSDRPLDEFSFRTVVVAALGAILLLLVLQAIAGRGPRKASALVTGQSDSRSRTRSVGRPMIAVSDVTSSGRWSSWGWATRTSTTPSSVETSAADTPSTSQS